LESAGAVSTSRPAAPSQTPPSGPFSAPAITLPKGGGAIRGIGEKFAANPVTGTGSLTVPIAVSPGRSGFGPQLSLSYDSGAGNGPFGVGWNLSLPSITRKTDKGLPKYNDAEESDVFILSGAEDLVPVYRQDLDGSWVAIHPGCQRDPDEFWVRDQEGRLVIHEDERDGYRVHRYRPRIEGLFARIERWTNLLDAQDVRWRSISKDNITTWYGKTTESRIFDPEDATRIFSWLICASYDDKGNAIAYKYVGENSQRVDSSQANESNRDENSRTANRYLKRICYGNKTSRLIEPDPADLSKLEWHFQVVFDYEEGHYRAASEDGDDPYYVESWASPQPSVPWAVRQDPFSTYRAGFEVRTYRLCRRVLMFHAFESLGTTPCLVRSTEFNYDVGPLASFITAVTQSGYVRQRDGNDAFTDKYLKKSLPPLEFVYSRARIDETVRDVEDIENLPAGVDGGAYQWVDLDGEGLSGALTEQAGAWFYKRNVSALPVKAEDGTLSVKAHFEPIERLASLPSTAGLASGRQQFLDLAGDGQVDVVEMDSPTPGFFERTDEGGWESRLPFQSLPNLEWKDPNLRFVDLTGDGHADVLITENEAFTWYPSLSEKGFGPAERMQQALDEEHGPRLVFADGTQSIYLSDMSGDGLTDLVRIRNGEVCYWPNLGHCRWGKKVAMDNAPWFDFPDQFDHKRIRLADIDGSGTTDILYLGAQRIDIYCNLVGNGWADRESLLAFPRIDNLSSVTAVDLLGNGTACLVWASPLPGDARRPMRYIDLMGGQKPHLLIKSFNNLGAETLVHYAPSTKFYLKDKAEGKPWITKLPFPVHVVERVETYDWISKNRFVTRYSYHHGYFDGIEREFRGFGLVEQFDTEEFSALNAGGQFPVGMNIEASSHVPPVLTKTWSHTGVYIGRNHISDFYAGLLDSADAGEYYREPGLNDAQARELLLDDTVLPGGLTAEEEREACRALKGSMLRQEVYALDGTVKEPHPYVVTEQNFTIRPLQPRAGNRHAVFFTHAREVISYHYERNPADPRIGHALTLEVDEFGNVLKSAAIGYGRRQPDVSLSAEDQAKQAQILATCTENRVTNSIDAGNDFRTPLPCESRTYELTGFSLPVGQQRFTFDDVLNACTTGMTIAYEQDPTPGLLQKRLIEHMRTLYRSDDLVGSLALGQLQPLGLPFESYKLAFTPGLINEVYGGRVSDVMLQNEGRYVHSEGDSIWWIPSGRIFHSPDPVATPAQEFAYARQHFFLAHRYRDPFHTNAISTESFVTYDAYDLLMLETRGALVDMRDALGNRVTVGERLPNGNIDPARPGNDYRVLQPWRVMDPNRNRTQVRFDALGTVVGTAVMGKPEENLGDVLAGFEADLTDAVIRNHLASPLADPHAILRRATTRLVYDLFAYYRTKGQQDPQPPVVYSLARETHDADLNPGERTKVQHSFSCCDGFGREIQKKIQAEAGPVPQRDANGKIIVGGNGQPAMTPDDVSPRWVGSSWSVFNNKGKPVRQYEPFFTDTHGFEFDVRIGVSPVLFYDPVERVVATLHPNHTWEKVIFDPWRQETWDVSDTVLVASPGADANAGEFISRLPASEFLPTWHAQRQGGALGPHEQAGAQKAAIHANTPTVAHADSLGRAFLTVAHNKFKYSDAPPLDPPVEEFHRTRIILDIEGNQRQVIDAKDRVVMRYDYDMLGNRVHQASMEAGERWMLNDVAGKPLYAWDSRDHRFRTAYDPLRRPTDSLLREGVGAEIVVGRNIYGETRPNPEDNNLRGNVVQFFDQAGVVTSDDYDFKGNLKRSARQLARVYNATLDWSVPVPLEAETYASRTRYDALNRPTQLMAPHSDQPGTIVNVIQPIYNEANLLEQVHAWLNRNAEPLAWLDPAAANLHAVTDIDYDAKGQRTHIDYGTQDGSGITTTYEYDPATFRLIHLKTRRNAANFDGDDRPGEVQSLYYTYDPVGNITHIRDDAQQTVYFANQRVEPTADYTYDAIYRLIEATGREHLGQAGGSPIPHSYNDAPRVGLLHPGDGSAMGRYLERYIYDTVGNFLSMQHRGSDPFSPGWTRTYAYAESSLVEPAKQSNRLTSTSIDSTTESYSTSEDGYDAHGNMLRMPQLQVMQWHYKDQLQMTQRQKIDEQDEEGKKRHGERTWYVYDALGQRVRKVTELANGNLKDERIYLGGFEIYRNHSGNNAGLVRETLHVMDAKRRIGQVETRNAVNDGSPVQLIRYQFGNHLGSASLELDDQAQIISYEEYTPYGSTAFLMMLAAIRARRKRYRYTGKERDEESGLYYHGARYYVPWLGRWIRSDPSEIDDGLNTYYYVRNNPVLLTDPNGTDSKLALPSADIGKFTKEELADATKTVFGEMTAKIHGDSEKEAKAIASTIFNRLKRIETARKAHTEAKAKLDNAKAKMAEAIKEHDELAKHPTKYKKELGKKKYEERLSEAKAVYNKAEKEVGQAGKAATSASSEKIAAESRIKESKRSNSAITLTDIVEQDKEYEGTKKGKADFKDFPSLSDPEQERQLKRWEMAKKAVEGLAKDPSKADIYEYFVSEKIKKRAPAKGTTQIGGNIFWK